MDSDEESVQSKKSYQEEEEEEEEEEEPDFPIDDKAAEEEFMKNALKQIEEAEKKDAKKPTTKKIEQPNINVTTEGITQDKIQNVNLASVAGLGQCHLCGTYYNGDMIIVDKDLGNACKHCYFGINHDEATRLKFDTDTTTKHGHGIAFYILECSKEHNSAKCKRKSDCYLCDYRQKKPLLNILNADMLGISGDADEHIDEKQNDCKNYNVDTSDYIEQHENVMFCGGMDSTVKFKVPKKLVI